MKEMGCKWILRKSGLAVFLFLFFQPYFLLWFLFKRKSQTTNYQTTRKLNTEDQILVSCYIYKFWNTKARFFRSQCSLVSRNLVLSAHMRIWLQVGCTPAFPDCPSVQCVDGLEELLGEHRWLRSVTRHTWYRGAGRRKSLLRRIPRPNSKPHSLILLASSSSWQKERVAPFC